MLSGEVREVKGCQGFVFEQYLYTCNDDSVTSGVIIDKVEKYFAFILILLPCSALEKRLCFH